MRGPVQIPPLVLWPTADTEQSWQYVEGQTPVDFTQTLAGAGYSAELLLMRCNEVRHRLPVALDAHGYLSAIIPAEVSADLRSCRRIDASFQINITAPIPELSEIWTGPVVVQEVSQ